MANKTMGISDDLAAYVVEVGAREPEILARLREETAAIPQHGMQIAPEEGAFLAMLAELTGSRRCIDAVRASSSPAARSLLYRAWH